MLTLVIYIYTFLILNSVVPSISATKKGVKMVNAKRTCVEKVMLLPKCDTTCKKELEDEVRRSFNYWPVYQGPSHLKDTITS